MTAIEITVRPFLEACEVFAVSRGLEKLIAGVNRPEVYVIDDWR
jgi:hypothetical protein